MCAVKFDNIETKEIKVGETGMIEVSLKKMTEGDRQVLFFDLYRTYKDGEGIIHKKGSMTLPLSCAGAIADAIKELLAKAV